jgi:hypothetical protein
MLGSKSLINDFNQIQMQIENICEESEIEDQLEKREEFEHEYYNVLALAECIINSDENSALKRSESMTNSSNSIKLPVVSIPDFDGSFEHWLEFRDTYLPLVHNCKTITPIQKFHYLKSSLKGNAKSVIESLEFSSNNYAIAWELLLTRFDNTNLLVRNHLKCIFFMQSLSKESPGLIRKLIDNILKNLRALNILGEPTEYWDTLIIYIVVSKLDPITEREWEQYVSTTHGLPKNDVDSNINNAIKLDYLLNFLRNRANILETLVVSHSRPVFNAHPKQTNTQFVPKIHCNVMTGKSKKSSTYHYAL